MLSFSPNGAHIFSWRVQHIMNKLIWGDFWVAENFLATGSLVGLMPGCLKNHPFLLYYTIVLNLGLLDLLVTIYLFGKEMNCKDILSRFN